MQKLAALLLTLLIAGCTFPGVYKINVQQGSIIKQEDLDQISVGMTRAQVHSVLGSPSVINPTDESRDHYMYTFQRAGQEIKQQQVVIYYENSVVTRYESELLPLTPAY